MSVLRFKLTMSGDRTAVSLKVGEETADGPFLFDNTAGSRISKVLNDFSNGIASFDDVREAGTYPDSLVLTERDHDQLYDRLGWISPAIADVLVRKQIGMAALYLGVPPQNRLLRRLNNVLRGPRNRPRSCGPISFVCRESDDIDEAYSRDYDVEWLRFEPVALVSAVTDALAKARQ